MALGRSTPLVSVIITTYNRANYVGAAVESVLKQSFTEFEIIIVDDGSTDNTKQVLQPFASRIQYIHQCNSERASARNRGLATASAPFVSFLDSDDLWLRDKLKHEVHRALLSPSVGLVYSDGYYINEQGGVLGPLRRTSHNGRVLEPLLHDNFVPSGAHLIRTDVLRAIGGFNEDRRLSGSEDWEAWVRLAAVSSFVHVPNYGFLYRVHGDATTARPDRMERSKLFALELVLSNPDLEAELSSCRAKVTASAYLTIATFYYAALELNHARSWLRKARRAYPAIISQPRYLKLALRLLAGRRLTMVARNAKRNIAARLPTKAYEASLENSATGE